MHWDVVAEGTGWDEYIDTAKGKLRPLKQRQLRRPRLSGAGLGSLPHATITPQITRIVWEGREAERLSPSVIYRRSSN
jgi:hypothetical protein